ncbi:MAG TPA: MBL fold metallo-hydrolase, partial [Myxococcota bacterium]|nr:MBL fold metallo-hydrolase [Myxococcota bacterium]
MRLRFLGTGGSFGIPIVGCDCAACASTDPRDSRLRASVSLQWDDWKVLIDAGPDLRQQALRAGLRAIDEVWLTHGHADHTNGIDDLRVFCHRGGVPHLLPIRGESRTLKEAAARFARDAQFLTLDASVLTYLTTTRPEALSLQLPFHGTMLTLDLVQSDPLTVDFSVQTSGNDGQSVAIKPGLHYRGVLRDEQQSIAA